jgi:hypothetical protein
VLGQRPRHLRCHAAAAGSGEEPVADLDDPALGLTDVQIVAVGEPTLDHPCFTYVQKLVLAFVDEVGAAPHVSDALFERIKSALTSREIVELLLVIGWYWTACRLTTVLDIAPEHAFGHGVLALLRLEQAKRTGQPAGEPHPDDYLVY